MIKILISSVSMANFLKDFKGLDITQISIKGTQENSHLSFFVKDRFLEGINCVKITPENSDSYINVSHENRWDSVRKLLKAVPEQPIIIEIHPKVINVIFQY
jgi:hypothetical protein